MLGKSLLSVPESRINVDTAKGQLVRYCEEALRCASKFATVFRTTETLLCVRQRRIYHEGVPVCRVHGKYGVGPEDGRLVSGGRRPVQLGPEVVEDSVLICSFVGNLK